MEVWEAACGGTWCPKCPPNCGLVPAFQPWTAMAGCVLPLSETLYHRSPVRPKGGTGSKPSAVCREESSQRCLALSALCGVMNNFWYSLGVLCSGEPQVLFLPISDSSELCPKPSLLHTSQTKQGDLSIRHRNHCPIRDLWKSFTNSWEVLSVNFQVRGNALMCILWVRDSSLY